MFKIVKYWKNFKKGNLCMDPPKSGPHLKTAINITLKMTCKLYMNITIK